MAFGLIWRARFSYRCQSLLASTRRAPSDTWRIPAAVRRPRDGADPVPRATRYRAAAAPGPRGRAAWRGQNRHAQVGILWKNWAWLSQGHLPLRMGSRRLFPRLAPSYHGRFTQMSPFAGPRDGAVLLIRLQHRQKGFLR